MYLLKETIFLAALYLLASNNEVYGQVKTSRVQSSSRSRTKVSSRYSQSPTYCDRPAAPNDASMQCQMLNDLFSCTATCREGLHFPDYSTSVRLDCEAKTGQWTPHSSFQDCIGGTGGYSQRSSARGHGGGGRYGAQNPLDICEKLNSPMDGSVQCKMQMGEYKCTGKCRSGYQFPDGSSTVELECLTDKAQWYPYQSFPNCEAIDGQYRSHGRGQAEYGQNGAHSQWQQHQQQQQQQQQYGIFSCDRPRSPRDGSMRCERTNYRFACTATCRTGYRFPEDFSSTMVLECSESGQWSPLESFPDCIAGGGQSGSYNHGQKNGGQSGIYGPGQFSSVSCPRPPAPVNGDIHCIEDSRQSQCQGTCNPGYEFPDRTRQKMLTCDSIYGQWIPETQFDDCQHLCQPPCENGGKCFPHNQCVCSSGYRGNRCQHPISLCDFSRLNAKMVAFNCSHSAEFTECYVSCPPGMSFNPPSTSLYRCTVDGQWNPPNAPNCVRDALCDQPPSPMNGRLACSGNHEVMMCTATCMSGYLFPDGFSELVSQCSYRSGVWSPTVNFPNCNPICSPECENGGRCVGHNQCLCPSDYRGPQCQYPLSNCDQDTFLASVASECNSNTKETVCYVDCGSTGARLEPPQPTVYTCSPDGVWVPSVKPVCQAAFEKMDRRGQSHFQVDRGHKTVSSSSSAHSSSGQSSWQSSSSGGRRITSQGQEGYDSENGGVYGWQGDISSSGHAHGKSSHSTSVNQQNRLSGGLEDEEESAVPREKTYKTRGKNRVTQNRIKTDVFDNSVNDLHESETNEGEVAASSGWEYLDISVSSSHRGVCSVWGFDHYRTFDGNLFTFPGTCRYILHEDCEDPSLTITVRKACLHGSSESCVREVGIVLGADTYLLSPETGLTKNGEHLSIPTSFQGIHVRKVSKYLTASFSFGSLWMDDEGTVHVVADNRNAHQERKCGLCGDMDGNAENDFSSQNDYEKYDILTFGKMWKALDNDEDCVEADLVPLPCNSYTEDNRFVSDTATVRCQALQSLEFDTCHEYVKPETFFRMCQMDCCSVGAEKNCECTTLSEYFRECARAGGELPENWRTPALCPPRPCHNGTEYQECGPACAATCERPTPICKNSRCVDGCHCPVGKVLEEGQCVPREMCPCSAGEKKYRSGEVLHRDCNTCVCQAGSWECTQEVCPSVCSVAGPHFKTFDGVNYDAYPKCPHVLVTNENFRVSVDYGEKCGREDSYDYLTCIWSISITTEEDSHVKLKPGFEVTVNDQEVHNLPLTAPGVYVEQATSDFIKARLKNGLEIFWDGHQMIHVRAPVELFDEVRGLCGTFNKVQRDDFLTPGGDVEGTAFYFVQRWQLPDSCYHIGQAGSLGDQKTPCEWHPGKEESAAILCSVMKEGLFQGCINSVAVDPYYEACLNDVCGCQLDDVEKCLCSSFANYAAACARNREFVPWRSELPQCALHCPVGQTYEPCAKSCTYSCSNIAKGHEKCSEFCVEGCVCPPGMAMDEREDECIPVSECQCEHSGHRYPPEHLLRIADEICKCSDGRWSCRELSEDDLTTPANPPVECDIDGHIVPSECVSECPRTCTNLHNHEPCTVVTCESGCRCEDGYVLHEESGACILPHECPCHHAGRSYEDGSEVNVECNSCVCQGSEWQCEEKPCPSTCSAWGDSHYKTFDGQMFDFQGQCDYVLVQAHVNDDVTAAVITQNVPCGSGGATCSKSVVIMLGDRSLTLTADEPLPHIEPNSGLTISEVGKFVLVHMDAGLSIQWDKGTRVYVTAKPIWKGKLQGLCGDFDGDGTDDFKPPSGGVPLALTHKFAESWKVQDYCEPAQPIHDACERKSERQSYAREKCEVLKSGLFSPCHSLVDSEEYYKRCIFDVCACDTGGDCACFCAVLAAYSYECARHDVIINWRSQTLCPVLCEACDRYSACISLCPPVNCENLLDDLSTRPCSLEPCVEGCEHKPCPAGHVRASPTNMTCVREDECHLLPCAVINGVEYKEGERIDDSEVGDACQSCYCRRGKPDCVGVPCTSPPPVLTTTPLTKECLPGWTEWFNSLTPEDYGGDDRESLEELIASQRVPCDLEQVKSVQCREVSTGAPSESTGDTVSCDVLDGMVCNHLETECSDYEMRIYCSCEEELCPPDQTWDECAFKCGEVCESLNHELVNKGECSSSGEDDGKCIAGCIEEECELPLLRRDPEICVMPDMCTCVLPSGNIVAPGEVITNGCEKCQCLSNALICSTLLECEPTTEPLVYSTTEAWTEETQGQALLPEAVKPRVGTTVTPVLIPAIGKITTPAACAYWSDWIDRSKPKRGVNRGEREDTLPYILQQTEGFCQEASITEIECRETEDGIDYTETGEPNLTCDLDSGFICKNSDQPDKKCKDYKIRYYCNCEEGETTTIFLKPTTPAEIYPCNEFVRLIDGDQPLPDSHLKSSSSASSLNGPQSARLSSKPSGKTSFPRGGAWTAAKEDEHQFIEVYFGGLRAIYGVVTKGKESSPEWVTSYYLLYSKDGSSYSYYPDENDSQKVFSGNFDGSAEVTHAFGKPFEAKYVRIEPLTWEGTISLRFDLLGCAEAVIGEEDRGLVFTTPKPATLEEEVCKEPMGLENGMVLDLQLAASPSLDALHSPQHAKLGAENSWIPRVLDEKQYIQVDFIEPRNITGVVTKGGEEEPMWVTAYEVAYSNDGVKWNKVTGEAGKVKVFPANFDPDSTVTNLLPSIVRARYLRILPIKWKNRIALQLEVLGCLHETECMEPVGIEDGLVTNYQLSGSSELDETSKASDGRLDSLTGWSPASQDRDSHLQVDFLNPMNVTAVVTRGRHDIPHWVDTYWLSYSNDGSTWEEIRNPGGNRKIFSANKDKDSPVINTLPVSIKARFFRIHPMKATGDTGMRIEFLGCHKEQVCLEPMGLESHMLSDGQVSASSEEDPSRSAEHVRINDPKGWSAESPYGKQYVMVDFLEPRNVSAIVTKGSGDREEWVKKYKLSFSLDKEEWNPVLDDQGNIKIFLGNKDAQTPVVNSMGPEPIELRYLSVLPIDIEAGMTLRLEVLGCYHPYSCIEPMGLENGLVSSSQLSASSSKEISLSPDHGRINSQTAWSPATLDESEFLKIDFMEPMNVTGFITRGRHDEPEWVTSYYVAYSEDGAEWDTVEGQDGEVKEFQGNFDGESPVTARLPTAIIARYLKIVPTKWNKWISMRLEVLGCYHPPVCMEPMGLEEGLLTDSQISASSFKDETSEPSKVRLNSDTAWTAAVSDGHQYLQIEFEEPRNITAVITKGREDEDHWVTAYTLAYSYDGEDWIPVSGMFGEQKVFPANEDSDMPVINVLPETVEAPYLRIIPTDWKDWISLRVELLGCYHPLEIEEVKPFIIPSTEPTIVHECPDPDDVETALLENAVITATSSAPNSDPSSVKLSSPAPTGSGLAGAWVPNVEDMHPVLMIELPKEILLTGVRVQGRTDEEHWIKTFRIIASKDNQTWLPVFGPNGEETIAGNTDQDTIAGHYFQKSAEARFVKVIPETWHLWPSFRMELLGCYHPEPGKEGMLPRKRPIISPVSVTVPQLCPELDPSAAHSCPLSCPPGLLCNGNECVDPVDCTCYFKGQIFGVTERIEDEETCSQCYCALGGHSSCQQKVCPMCLENKTQTWEPGCECSCAACSEEEMLCPSSGECVPENRWCDGVVDCPDDETNCLAKPTEASISEVAPGQALPVAPEGTEIPTKIENDTCEILGRHIRTLDGQNIEYEHCHHVALKDIELGSFSATIHRDCRSHGGCIHWIEFVMDEHEIRVTSNLDVKLDGIPYTATQLGILNKKPDATFTIEKIGDQVVIKVPEKGLKIVYDVLAHLRIQVPQDYKEKVSGLCGYYSGLSSDDQLKPDGQLAYTSKEFGDSWSVESREGEECTPILCAKEIMDEALEICVNLREDPFSRCAEVISIDTHIDFCMSSVCECMQKQGSISTEKCKCESYLSLVEECEKTLGQTALRNWRLKVGCAPECPPGMTWNDCGPSCQLTCDTPTIDQCSEECMAGCFCPDGMVLNGDNCVPPERCSDKVCQGFGDPHLETYDGLFFPFFGEGTFLITASEGLDFAVEGITKPCSLFARNTCLIGIRVKHNSHVVRATKSEDVMIDGKDIPVENLPVVLGGVAVLGFPGKTFIILIPTLSVEVRFYGENSGFAVKVPSRRFFNRTIGLCGDCDDNTFNEIKEDKMGNFVCSWMTEGDPEDCHQAFTELPEVTATVPSCELVRSDIFKPCHALVDPKNYIEACSFDTKHTGVEKGSLCKTLLEYSRQCCQAGMVIEDWPTKFECDVKCSETLEFHQCHDSCSQTCEGLKNKTLIPECDSLKLDGCFCPDGKALKGGYCIDPNLCETCDEEGHVPGDEWKEGPCKQCICNDNLAIECIVEACPAKPVCKEDESLAKEEKDDESCCEKYACVPAPTLCTVLEELPSCPEGEVAKIHSGEDLCPEFKCECDPLLCSPVVWPSDLEDGEVAEAVKESCCPKVEVVCKKETCPEEITCSPGFEVVELEGVCCTLYKCKPAMDLCVYNSEYDVQDGLQVPVDPENRKPVKYKPGDVWNDGLCQNCTCVQSNDQFVPQCLMEQCIKLEARPENKDYALFEYSMPWQCCPDVMRMQCKDEHGNLYMAGEEWQSLDDPCIKYICELTPLEDVQKVKKVIDCPECPKTSDYIPPSKILGQCCGICRPSKCEEGGEIYLIDNTWTPKSNPCQEAKCINEAGVAKIVYTNPSCPKIPEDCPLDQIVINEDGCCEMCNITSELHCSSAPILPEETVGRFSVYNSRKGGYCKNIEPVPDVLQCTGACHSESYYSLEDGDFKSNCQCCKVNITVQQKVKLRCPDGSFLEKKFLQPKTCQCSKCAPKDDAGKVERLKKGKKTTSRFNQSPWSQVEEEDENDFKVPSQQEQKGFGFGQEEEGFGFGQEDEGFGFGQEEQDFAFRPGQRSNEQEEDEFERQQEQDYSRFRRNRRSDW